MQRVEENYFITLNLVMDSAKARRIVLDYYKNTNSKENYLNYLLDEGYLSRGMTESDVSSFEDKADNCRDWDVSGVIRGYYKNSRDVFRKDFSHISKDMNDD